MRFDRRFGYMHDFGNGLDPHISDEMLSKASRPRSGSAQSMPQTQFNGITVIIRLVVEQEFGKCCGFGILPVVAVPNIERPEIVQTIAAYRR